MKSTTKEMTSGSPMKLILGFSVPLLFGFLFQQFYNLVDTMIVGRLLGKYALAGVGSTGSINFLILGFCTGVCSGYSIPISQMFGAGDYNRMRRFVTHSLILTGGFAAAVTVLSTVFCRQILTITKTPEEVMDYAYTYILIIFLGTPVICLYNLLSSILRALGDSKHPVQFLVISSFVNIGLDFFFILVLKMGVAGAALATVISQVVSAVMCLVYIVRKVDLLKLSREDWRIDPFFFRILNGMGIPMGLQYSITAIGSVILQTAINGQGADAVAAVAAAVRVSGFFCCPFDAMGSTMATYGGQNVGAKKLERLGTGLRDCTLLGVIYSLAAFVILYFFGRSIVGLFVSGAETAVLDQARLFLIVNSAFYIPLALVNIVRFLIQGMGFSMFAVLAGVCEMVARSAAALLLVPRNGFMGIAMASPLAWILADLFLIPAFLHVRKILLARFNSAGESPASSDGGLLRTILSGG